MGLKRRGGSRSALFDDVLLDRLDGHAGRPQPCESALDLVVGALEFDRDQAHILRHAGATDIKNQVELLDQLVKDGLPDEGFGVAQVVTFADTFHLRTRRWRCSRRHSCHPIQRLVERYFSPKSGKTVTTVPSRKELASLSAATIAAPDDCPTRMPSNCPSAYAIS